MLIKLANYPDADKETGIIKMCIVNTISKENKTNYKTKSFKVIKAFGYNGATMAEKLQNVNLDTFTLYALKGLLLTEKRLGLFLRLLKGT